MFLFSYTRILVTCFGGAVNRNNFYFLILLFISLHVSASRGHPQVKFAQSFSAAITATTDPCLVCTVNFFILCYVIYYNLKFEV
jgi:hypothetical protein